MPGDAECKVVDIDGLKVGLEDVLFVWSYDPSEKHVNWRVEVECDLCHETIGGENKILFCSVSLSRGRDENLHIGYCCQKHSREPNFKPRLLAFVHDKLIAMAARVDGYVAMHYKPRTIRKYQSFKTK